MIRKATRGDGRMLADMAVKMWDSHDRDELAAEFEETIGDEQAAFFIMYVDDAPVGFAQCGLRHDYVEGTDSSPVGYLEGVFVEKPWRRRGCARALLAACEQWAKDMGSSEFASDCELDNADSLRFHLAMGFEEANRIICFRKTL